jgi:hypothetical protein
MMDACSSRLTTVEKVMMLQYMEYTHLQQQHAGLQSQPAELHTARWCTCISHVI